MTARYRTIIKMPEVVGDFFERITEVGYVVDIIGPQREVIIEFEQETADEYLLAETVRDLKDTIGSIGFIEHIDIERPTKV